MCAFMMAPRASDLINMLNLFGFENVEMTQSHFRKCSETDCCELLLSNELETFQVNKSNTFLQENVCISLTTVIYSLL